MKGWKFWLGMIVGVGALVLFARDLEWGPFLNAWEDLSLGWYGLGIFFFCFSFFLRCPRWKLLVSDLGSVSFSLLARAFFVGMLINRILPARLGEVARCVVLKRRAGLSLVGLLTTVAVEKSFDGLALLTVTALALALLPAGELPADLQPLFEEHRAKILTGAIGVPLALLACAWMTPILLAFWESRRPAGAEVGWMGRFVRSGIAGLATLRRGSQTLVVVFWTGVVWLTLVLSAYCALRAFGFELPLSAGVVLCAAIGISVTIPQAPSYVGVYQLAVQGIMVSIYQIPLQEAKAFAIGIWALQIIPVGIIGFACLRRLGTSLDQATHVEKELEASE
ncbi:MAG: flippase-like domain-containing protein [Candidatus Omnitrophica bacterium]|nr:flippase-like domain-containing protein [Candidatus Omnitrophota bacterium]